MEILMITRVVVLKLLLIVEVLFHRMLIVLGHSSLITNVIKNKFDVSDDRELGRRE